MKINQILLSGFLLCTGLFLTGCTHTVQGFGADMQQTGKKIEKSVDK